jgi:hypothetical protein
MKLTATRSRISDPARRKMNLVMVVVAGRPALAGPPASLLCWPG